LPHRTQLIDIARPCNERLVFLKDHDLYVAQGAEVGIAEISLPFAVGALFDLKTKLSLARRPDVSLSKRKGYSADVLTKLIAESHGGSFDFIKCGRKS